MRRIATAITLFGALVLCTVALASPALSGAFNATIGKAPLGGKLAGAWSMTFSGSKYTITYNGSTAVNGTFSLSGKKVTFNDKSGKYACHVKGVYDYSLAVRSLTFKRVSDSCTGRRAILAATFTKKFSGGSGNGY